MTWFWQRRREAQEEIEAHLAERIDDLVDTGLSRDQASHQARREFGNPTRIAELARESWGPRWFDELIQDLRYAARMQRRTPGFTVIAVLSLALGIGATTAILTLIESALLHPLDVPNPEQLRLLTWRAMWAPPAINSNSRTLGWIDERMMPDGSLIHTSFEPSFLETVQRANSVFDSLFAFKEVGRVATVINGSAQAVNCFLVSDAFYRGLQLIPAIGRAIQPNDDSTSVLISYQFWNTRFGRDPSVIGKTITLNQVPVTIIGVNPEHFTGVIPGATFEIWAPLSLPSAVYGYDLLHGSAWALPIMGRLKQGVSDVQAQAALDTIFQQQVEAGFPSLKPGDRPRLFLRSGARGIDYLNDHYRGPLFVLLALAMLTLLIACTNVANLLLARCADRQREISLRLALGAGTGRVMRQLFTEGLLLAAMAGAAGVLFGYSVRNGIPALLGTPWRPEFNPKVLAASTAVAFITGILFSLAPALQSRNVGQHLALKDGGRTTRGLSKLRAARPLVVLQVALSFLLLVSAGLCVRTLGNLRRTPLGFNPDNILLLSLDPPRLRYTDAQNATLLRNIREGLITIPGVQSATFSVNPMVTGSAYSRRLIALGGKNLERLAANIAPYNEVGRAFFETMQIPILYGRALNDRDTPRSQSAAAVVTAEFARRYFHKANPVGEYFGAGGLGKGTFEIVGVCGDTRLTLLRGPTPPGFFTYWPQSPHPGVVTFEVRHAASEAALITAIRESIHAVDPGLVVAEVRTQNDHINRTLSQECLLAALATAFGVLALLLACIGVYGVIAYTVARRTAEIGIRVALGAAPAQIIWMILRETLLLVAIGAAIGIPSVWSLGPLLDYFLAAPFSTTFFYGLQASDPTTIASAALILAVAAAFSGYLPANRAARMNSIRALTYD